MKHINTQSSLLASATEDEIIVSQILIDLKSLVSLSESLANFNWGCRRKRSCLDEDPSLLHESSCPPPIRKTKNEIEERKPQIKLAEVVVGGGGGTNRSAVSPTTPLLFSPSESDENPKHLPEKTSRKQSNEDYIDIIKGLTQRRNDIRGEVENVKKFYNKLQAYNSELKAMKQVINNFPRKEEPRMEIINGGGISYGTGLTQIYRIHVSPHQQPYLSDPTAQQKLQYLTGPIQTRFCSSNSGVTCGSRVEMGPLGIDLNFPAEETFGETLDVINAVSDERSRFADARRKRRRLMKAKSMRSAAAAMVKYCQQPGVRDGNEITMYENFICIPDEMAIPYTDKANSVDALIDSILPSMQFNRVDSNFIISRLILSTKNENINEINNQLIKRFSRSKKSTIVLMKLKMIRITYHK
ncbi:hypothetical protein OROGR_026377 [Orobanche gracilis]